jgi:activator of 2-hydroxyglutaryl-CoA dehydratase
MITVGIDVGSITTKAAVVEDGKLISDRIMKTGFNAKDAGKKVFDDILAELNLTVTAIDGIISTGYGRNSIDFASKAVTEITCGNKVGY